MQLDPMWIAFSLNYIVIHPISSFFLTDADFDPGRGPSD